MSRFFVEINLRIKFDDPSSLAALAFELRRLDTVCPTHGIELRRCGCKVHDGVATLGADLADAIEDARVMPNDFDPLDVDPVQRGGVR